MDSIRILTWGLWGHGPIYTARLNTSAHVIFKQPTAIILSGGNQEGIQILRKTPMRKRRRLKEAELRNTAQNSPAIMAIAEGDTEISAISPLPIAGVVGPGVVFRISAGATYSVAFALGRYGFCRPFEDALRPDGPISHTSDFTRWASAEPDRAYVRNRCAVAPEEAVRGALLNTCLDALRYMIPGDDGFKYDGISKVRARLEIRPRPGLIFCNAELRGALRCDKLAGETECARIRAKVRVGGGCDILHPIDHFRIAVASYGSASSPTKSVSAAVSPAIAEDKAICRTHRLCVCIAMRLSRAMSSSATSAMR